MEWKWKVADVLVIDGHVKQSMLDKVCEAGRFWHGRSHLEKPWSECTKCTYFISKKSMPNSAQAYTSIISIYCDLHGRIKGIFVPYFA